MRYTADEIRALLPDLDSHIADELESESLDFKECPDEDKLRRMALEMAICFGNAEGGTAVFGIADKVLGRSAAIKGIPFAPDLDAIKAHLYDTIDPKLPVQFEWLEEGTHRLLLMHVIPTGPPYTNSSGRGWVRVGKDCKPLVGSLLQQLRASAGYTDPTKQPIPLRSAFQGISPAALEILRREMRRAGAAPELLDDDDEALCERLGLIRENRLTLGGLLLAGREEIIAEYAPFHEWKYVRMRIDTDYDAAPVTSHECLLVALEKIQLLIGQQNTITTVPAGFFHTEFPQYPVIALREALLNAFAHRDYTIPGMVFIRHWQDRIEIDSPGGFVGGVTPQNILHHAPATRNRYLVETILLATRLVNRSNLGVPRIFRALLEEGKEPPVFEEIGQTVSVTFLGQAADKGFKTLIEALTIDRGATLDVDTLLLLHFFYRRREARWAEIHEVYPYNDRQLKEKLAFLEHRLSVIEHSGSGQGTTYRLSRQAAALLNAGSAYDLTRRLDKEAIKVRILTLLNDRPLTNRDIRAFTDLSRNQVTYILQELEREGQIRREGTFAQSRWLRAKAQ